MIKNYVKVPQVKMFPFWGSGESAQVAVAKANASANKFAMDCEIDGKEPDMVINKNYIAVHYIETVEVFHINFERLLFDRISPDFAPPLSWGSLGTWPTLLNHRNPSADITKWIQ